MGRGRYGLTPRSRGHHGDLETHSLTTDNRWIAVVASDLGRAVKTVQLALGGLGVRSG